MILLAALLLLQDPKPPVDFYGDPLPPGALVRFGTLQFRHTADVFAVAFHPDGKTLISVDSGTIHWWSVETGSPIRPPVKKEGRGFAAVFSGDLKRLATGEYRTPDGWMMGVYDADTGKVVRVIPAGDAFTGQPVSVALSHDGSLLAYAGVDGQAGVWDVATGARVATFKGHEGLVWSTVISPDGRFVATTGDDKTLRFWTLKTGESAGRIDLSHKVGRLAYSSDGARVAGGSSDDRAVRVWNFPKLNEVSRAANPNNVNFLPLFSGDGAELFVVTEGSTGVHEVASGRELGRFQGGGFGAALSSDGLRFAAGSGPMVRIWNSKTGAAIHDDRPFVMTWPIPWFAPDDATLRIFGPSIQTWDAATGRLRSSLELSKFHIWLALSADGRHYAYCGGAGRRVSIRTAADDAEVASVQLANNVTPTALALSNGAKFLAAGDQNPSSVHVYEVESGNEFRTSRDKGPGSQLAFSPDGKLLATEDKEGWVHLWDLAADSVRQSLKTDLHNAGDLRFSPDGSCLFVASQGKGIQIWSVDTAETLAVMPTAARREPFMAVSRDGRYVAGPHEDLQVKVWETVTGREVLRLDPARGNVHQLAFNSKGDRLLVVTSDLNGVLWEVFPAGAGEAKLEDLWADLASADAAKAHRAVAGLSRRGADSISFLRERLIRKPPPGAVRKWVEALNVDELETLNRAKAELRRYDAANEYQAIQAEKDCPPATAAALRGLVSGSAPLRSDDAGRLRRLRALTAIAQGGSKEGVALLREMAECVLDARIREEAGRSLDRR